MIVKPRVLSVAPMIDWTDRHCRRFHREISRHTWVYTEMITTGALIHGDRRRFLAYSPEEHPIAFQIGGSDPSDLAQCAKWVEEAGYDELNLNCGCPSERVQKGAFGACLMAEPQLVADCVKAMRDACSLDVTVKHRIGLDYIESTQQLHDFVGAVSEAGCHTFIVHARNAVLKGLSPKENREIPPLRYAVVKELKTLFPHLQVILNGGIQTLADIESHLQWADGCMIGREAYTNPWLLAGFDALIERYAGLKAGSLDELELDRTRTDVIQALRPYVEAEMAKGENLRNLTKSWLGLFHGQAGGRLYRQVLSDAVQLKTNRWSVVEMALQQVSQFA
ncbi:tRNA dihydrouridine(20/20a) synthase DusA [Limnobacter humi]|uniref:tRNA-dihydrouridine(20/20a) synthase n=1 Tax=Limnobacter humi TaxID=1778671 RepID=A0ABT1WFT4_9BURK|nr:tRNA dihydrouridine(20/20a) synthase DusA [Limnobacter humi]MCQ8896380.1 tRNA dihydrouridine(20/20a) synthase DusA [Limnobacter humi]